MMSFVLVFVGFLIGLVIASFTLIQALICLIFGIPTARNLTSEGLLVENNNLISRYVISFVVLGSLFGVITYLVVTYLSALRVGYGIGVVLAILFGLGQMGSNQNNLSDFMQINKRYFKE
jgi:hypothetical protein